ncbi:MAG: hypothetical protein EP302_03430 [Bacteroidetes bacterium]|nr:MAG: hypothetical protein EP302_03430 [Bacteroidota bacterium]UCE69795.1 MAG: hypothetical protein JSW57_02480 [Flavobacteriaceae bacterium]
MVLTSILVLLAIFLMYLLWMPMELCIDSYSQRYFMRLGILARIGVEKDPVELIRLHLKIFFLNFYWRPSDIRSWGGPRKKSASKRKGSKKQGITFYRVKRLLNSFRVKSFRLELDTGNPVLNAKLYPWVYFIGQQAGDVGINFLGRNYISLQIVNRPIYILNAFINPKK